LAGSFIEVFEHEARKVGDAQFLVREPYILTSSSPFLFVVHQLSLRVIIMSETAEKMNLKLIEPLQKLFKDEVRIIGRELGVPQEILGRHSFPRSRTKQFE